MPRHRLDRYGRPLPGLAPASRQSLVQSPQNVTMRQYVLTLLEQDYADLFQRGVHADVTLTLHLVDGIMQSDVKVSIHRRHRAERED